MVAKACGIGQQLAEQNVYVSFLYDQLFLRDAQREVLIEQTPLSPPPVAVRDEGDVLP